MSGFAPKPRTNFENEYPIFLLKECIKIFNRLDLQQKLGDGDHTLQAKSDATYMISRIETLLQGGVDES